MPAIDCPQCHLPAASAMGKAYCPHCGWNRSEADQQTRFFLRLLPLLVVLFDAPLIFYVLRGRAEVPVLAALGVVAIIPAILVVLVVKGKIGIQLSAASSGAVATREEVAGPFDDMMGALGNLPRPRPVRLSPQGKIKAVLVPAILFMAVGVLMTGAVAARAGAREGSPSAYLTTVPAMLVAVVAGLVLLRQFSQQKRLVGEGELAVGRVTQRWVARNGPNIRYEFTTPRGERFSRSAADSTRKLSTGMSVPVFYNSQSPKHQVALCGSLYEVILPGAA